MRIETWDFATKIEYFGCVVFQKNTSIHLIQSQLFFFDFLPPKAGLLTFINDGEGMTCVNVRVFSGGNESVCAMLFILFFF